MQFAPTAGELAVLERLDAVGAVPESALLGMDLSSAEDFTVCALIGKGWVVPATGSLFPQPPGYVALTLHGQDVLHMQRPDLFPADWPSHHSAG